MTLKSIFFSIAVGGAIEVLHVAVGGTIEVLKLPWLWVSAESIGSSLFSSLAVFLLPGVFGKVLEIAVGGTIEVLEIAVGGTVKVLHVAVGGAIEVLHIAVGRTVKVLECCWGFLPDTKFNLTLEWDFHLLLVIILSKSSGGALTCGSFTKDGLFNGINWDIKLEAKWTFHPVNWLGDGGVKVLEITVRRTHVFFKNF